MKSGRGPIVLVLVLVLDKYDAEALTQREGNRD